MPDTLEPLTSAELEEIEKLADAATPGPWMAWSRGGSAPGTDSDTLGWEVRGPNGYDGPDDGPPEPWTGRGQFVRWADAALIAALNPENARRLVAMARRARVLELETKELRAALEYDEIHEAVVRSREEGAPTAASWRWRGGGVDD